MNKRFFVVAALVAGCLTLLFCNARVAKSSKTDPGSLRCIVVTEIMPLADSTWKFTIRDTLSISIFYYANMTAYKLPYQQRKIDGNGKVLSQTDQYQYFVFDHGESRGIIYDSYDVNKRNTVPVDSMMKNGIWCEQNSETYYSSTFDRNIVGLISSEKSVDGTMLTEAYSYRRKEDSTTYGVFKLVFTNKISGIRFSLSRELDSIKGMKLIATNATGSFQYLKDGIIVKDTASSSDFMREVILSPRDSMDIMQYFTRYRQEKK